MTKKKENETLMIQKQSWLRVSDNTNIRWMQVFHLYKGFNRRSTTLGYFVKGSARVVEPPRVEYKGFKLKYNKKGDICRGLLVRVKKPLHRHDGSVLHFASNNCVIVKKKQDLKSKYLLGPVPYSVYRTRLKSVYSTVL